MGWVKDEGGASATHDGTARIVRERYLLGGGEHPMAVCMSPQSFMGGDTGDVPLPARNSAHPMDPACLLDCYQVDSDGAVNAIVAMYSSDRRFRFPTVNATPQNGFTWTLSTLDLSYSLPYAMKVREIIGDALQSTGYFDLWKFVEDNVYEPAQEVRMRFSVLPEKVPNALNVMYKRQNRLHLISGEYWLFLGGELSQGSSVGEYEMSVGWRREAGVPFVPRALEFDSHGDLSTNPPSVIMPAVRSTLANVPNETWHKPPFHKVFILPNPSGDPEDEPNFASFCPYKFDESGFAAVIALIP